MIEINYYSEDIEFTLEGDVRVTEWIEESTTNEGFEVDEISVIFCSDDYLLEMNRTHLNHDYYTDIITFDYNEDLGEEGIIGGDLFISVDRVKENSEEYGVAFIIELRRVIIHGVLHLMGYKDASDEERQNMRSKEDYYLMRYEK